MYFSRQQRDRELPIEDINIASSATWTSVLLYSLTSQVAPNSQASSTANTGIYATLPFRILKCLKMRHV